MVSENLSHWQGRLEALLAGEIRRVETILNEREKAIGIARGEINRRLDQMNEVREQLASQKSEFATREALVATEQKVVSMIEGTEEKLLGYSERNRGDIDALARRLDLREGRGVGVGKTGQFLATAAFIVLGIAGLVITLIVTLKK